MMTYLLHLHRERGVEQSASRHRSQIAVARENSDRVS